MELLQEVFLVNSSSKTKAVNMFTAILSNGKRFQMRKLKISYVQCYSFGRNIFNAIMIFAAQLILIQGKLYFP